MQAQFRILNGTEVVSQMVVEYYSTKELNDIFHAVRKEWAEFMVEMEMNGGVMTYNHTYAEQIRRFGK